MMKRTYPDGAKREGNPMQRSKRILVVSHCVLNQNTVIPDEARSPGMMRSAVEWADQQGYGLLQLPCPEFTFLGPDRPPMTREQYDTPEYRAHCRRILEPFVEQLAVYQKHGYELAGGMGIARSPSCDPGRGVFMEELHRMARESGVKLDFFWQIPGTEEGRFDSSDAASIYGPVNP
jgi:predicted secreted protein